MTADSSPALMAALKQFRFARDKEGRHSAPKEKKLSLTDTTAEDVGSYNAFASGDLDELLTGNHTESSCLFEET